MRMRYLPPRNASLYASIIIHISIMKYIQFKNKFMEIWKKNISYTKFYLVRITIVSMIFIPI